ncbi:hypothetical protein GCM10009665_48300 [Kitasatospora nipponensis]|uniref:Uncharacterized protein n=1 Tax=Kitasatospora nipponensis TaxID=258049 RepID=A0ABN1WMS4_9ACTN
MIFRARRTIASCDSALRGFPAGFATALFAVGAAFLTLLSAMHEGYAREPRPSPAFGQAPSSAHARSSDRRAGGAPLVGEAADGRRGVVICG